MKPVAILTLTILLAPFAAHAQDEEEKPEEGPDPNVLFSKALLAYRDAKDIVVQAEVKTERGEGGGMFAGAQVIIQTSSGGGGTPFEGKCEAWRGADGATVIVSKKGLPGFGLYMDLDRTIERTTTEDKSYSLTQLQNELAPILDQANFTRYAMAAKFEHTLDPTTGDHVFTGALARKLVRAPAKQGIEARGLALAGFGGKKVLRCEAKLVVGKEGRFKQIVVKVVHSDPMAKMTRQILIRGGAFQPVQPEKKKDDGKEKEGDKSVYTLTLDGKGPSERARAFKRSVTRLIEEK